MVRVSRFGQKPEGATDWQYSYLNVGADAAVRHPLELIKLGHLADRPHTGRHRLPELTSELDEPQARARVIARLRALGVDIARAPSEALADFIESCAAGYNPAGDPMLRERGRYSKRKREHARMLRTEG